MKHTIILNEETTFEAIGKVTSGNCEPIGNDEGKCFTSIKDAAEYAGVSPQCMWNHLQPNGTKTCRGHVYFYIKKRDKSFDKVMKQLTKATAEVQRRKADEEDARKWREYQAAQEAIRREEEKRLEAIRKAEEKRQKEIAKLQERIAKYEADAEKAKTKWEESINAMNNAQMELENLMDNNQQEVA